MASRIPTCVRSIRNSGARSRSKYSPDFGGGLRREGTFVEFSKTLIDRLHAWVTTQPGQELDRFAYTTFALHFYESVVVVEKRPIDPPRRSQTGRPSF